MIKYYDIVSRLKAAIENIERVNKCEHGTFDEISLQRAKVFPYTHFDVVAGTPTDNTFSYDIPIMCMSQVREIGESDNKLDVLNEQLIVINQIVNFFRVNGELYPDYQLEGEPTFQKFENDHKSDFAGWDTTLTIVTNNDLPPC